jgi:Domain of unknown function (DUF397)
MTQTSENDARIQQPADTAVTWTKASGSSNNGGCVEVASIDDMVAVRDSKNPDGPPLFFTRREIAYFLDAVKAGEFDQFVE